MATVMALALVAPAPAAAAAGSPSAPRSVLAVPGNQRVTVNWRPPRTTGGAAINQYRVVRWRAGSTTKQVVKVGASARTLLVKSLTNGTRYYFHVSAHTKHGWGSPSAATSAVPRTTPSAPRSIRATPKDGAIDLAWSAPASNGGAAIGKYAVRVSTDGGQTWTPAVTASGTDQVTTRSATVTGLTDGSPRLAPVTPYLLHVRAHNAAGWGPWAPARLASAALEQMPPFVPSNSFGDAAAAAFGDHLTGSYWTGGYPTAAGAGDWHDGGPLVVPIPPNCTNPYVACPGGVPQDPPPTFVLDLTPQEGDTPRRTVANITGAARYDLSYRARVSTSVPIAATVSGSECTVSVDSTPGASPDLRFDARVGFANVGWQTRPSLGVADLSGLEDDDHTWSGAFACSFSEQYFEEQLRDLLVDVVDGRLNELLSDMCGADDPTYWQPCHPILDNPPPAPPAAAPPPSCPDASPLAGPYMTVSCDGTRLVRTCAAGWLDANKRIADGCERSSAGVVALQLNATTAQSLADHLSGSFFLGGYPEGVGTGSWHAGPNPLAVPMQVCGSSIFGCPNNVPQAPRPTLAFDLSEQGDPGPRRQGSVNPASETPEVTLTLRGRAHLTAPAAFMHSGVGCQLQIDTTAGEHADIELNVPASGTGSGPLTIGSYWDGDGWVTLRNLEQADISVGPHRWCNYFATALAYSQVTQWVRDSLVAWAQREGALCGAPDPYYWQRCPSS